MANDPMRSKAAAVFGKEFMNAVKGNDPKGNQVNSAQALQKRANARPIPVYKDGGQVSSRVANRAAMAGYKKGGECKGKKGVQTSSDTARKLATEMGGMKDGGKVDERMKRKTADIEKDYKIALAKGKNADIAKAKYEQRMADAQDDYAKWTKADRSQTSAAEKAAEMALSEARKTKGQSIRDRDAKVAKAMADVAKPAAPAAAPDKSLEADFDATFAARKDMPKAQMVSAKAKPKVAKPPRPAVVDTKAPAQRMGRAAPATAPAAAPAARGIEVPASLSTASRGMMAPASNVAAPGAVGVPSSLALANRGKMAPKAADPFAKDKSGNYLDTSAAGSRARLAARFGLKDGGEVGKYAVGGAGKTRKDQAPIKRKEGGTNKKEGVSTRPTTPSGRRMTMKELEQSNRDTGGMSAAELKRIGEAIGRGNRTPYEPIPKAKGGAAKVRKGMMSKSGDILRAVKPKKGIGGIM